MKNFWGILFVELMFASQVFAQHSVQGTVVDKANNERMDMVSVRLVKVQQTDTVLVSGALTDEKGFFILQKVQDDSYTLIFNYLGYKEKSLPIVVDGKAVNVGTVALTASVTELGQVEVRGTAAEMTVKGDTLEYNAGAYQTPENAMVEDLLRKMPGVEVSSDGTVTINGEQVKGVRVDGKKFFGSDVQTATKNIPADMIDKVQVIDQQSDMARLTGFEDDETERIINLTLKKQKKKGLFGNFTGGVGADLVNKDNKFLGYDKYFFRDDFRYNANLFLNILQGETQSTILGSANNTNELRSGRGRGSISSNSGITRSENLGVNISADPNASLELGGNASFTHSNNNTSTNSEETTYTDSLVYKQNRNKNSESGNYDVNLRFEAEWDIDSLNKLNFQPTIAYTRSNTFQTEDYLYLNDTTVVNEGSQGQTGHTTQLQGGLKLTYKHKFLKQGRALTMRADMSVSDNNTRMLYQSSSTTQDAIDQQTRRKNTSWSYSLRTSYVEPLYKDLHFLETILEFKGSNRFSDKKQFDNLRDGVLDSAYSNHFTNQFYSEALELNYMLKQKSYTLTAGFRVNPSQTLSHSVYTDGYVFDTLLTCVNYAPQISFKYKFGKKKFARIQYRGTTSQPSLTQLEPTKDNSNATSLTVGNPDLQPQFEHSLRFMYSSYNADRMSSITTGLRGTLTKDALVYNNIYDKTGKVYRQTVNAEALPWSVGADVMFSTPVVKNRLHLNSRTSLNYQSRIAYIAREQDAATIDVDNLLLGDKSRTGNLRAQEDLSLRFTHDIVEVGLKGQVSYLYTHNNLNKAASNAVNFTATADLTFHLPYRWNISTDFGYTGRYGYNLQGVNEMLWNFSIDKTFLAGAGTLSLKVYDILNQRKNIVEIVGENYVRYEKYNTLPTYFTINFTYKINRMGDLKAKGMAGKMQEMQEAGIDPSREPNRMPMRRDGEPPMGPPQDR